MWIPGWDSIANTSWWSGFYFWASIASLIGLGVAEVASHRYSERKDELASIEQETLQRRHDEEMGRLHLETAKIEERSAQLEREAAQATENAARANERAAELKLALEREIAARQPRKITPEQHAAVVEFLRNTSPKGEIVVVWKLFDEEAEHFARQVISVLNDAGFKTIEKDGPLSFKEKGAWIVVRDLKATQASPTAIGAVQKAFGDIVHVQLDGVQRVDPFPDLGEFVIAIGPKP